MPLLHESLLTIVQHVAAGGLIALSIGLTAHRAGALTRSGVVAAVIVGALTFGFGGPLVALAIVIFFVSGSALGRLRNATADNARRLAAKGERRDAVQVAANGGIATVCAVGGFAAELHGWPHASSWMLAALCSIAAASGDTWSTEIGVFANGPAHRITDLRPVAAGTSGGITMLGTLAAPIGGAVIGLAGLARPDLLGLGSWLALSALTGLGGSTLDSWLGATLQARWRCAGCGQTIETRNHPGCGAPATLVGGLAWLDNDGVNAATTLGGAALGFLAGALLL